MTTFRKKIRQFFLASKMAGIRVVKGFRPFFCCPGQGVKDITPPVDVENVFFAFYRRVFAEAAAPMAAESAFKVGEHVVLVEQDEHGGLSVVCWDKAG